MKEGEGREEQKLSLDGLPKLTFEQKWKWCAVPCTASLAGMRSESRMRLRAAIELCPGGRRASSPPAHPQTNTDRLRYSSPLFAAEDLTRLVETRFVLIIIPACCQPRPSRALIIVMSYLSVFARKVPQPIQIYVDNAYFNDGHPCITKEQTATE
jgi:hypothetical protein